MKVGVRQAPLSKPEDSKWRPPACSVGPFTAALALVVAADVMGSVPLLLVGVLAACASMPLVEDLGRRILTSVVWVAAIAGVASLLPGFPVNGGGPMVLSVVIAGVVAAMARRRGWPTPVPTGLSTVLVVSTGAALTAVMLALPLVGRGAEVVLLDVSAHYDNLPHFNSMAGLLDGDPRSPGYNYGYHFLGALVVGIQPVSPSGLSQLAISEYAWVGVGLVSVAALLIGLLAADIAGALARQAGRPAADLALPASVAFLVVAPLSGLLGAHYTVGHGNFLWSVVLVSVASWLALDSGPSWRALGFVALGILIAFTVYRSTQVGMALPAAVVVKTLLRTHSRLPARWQWAASLMTGALVFSGWLPFHYHGAQTLGSLTRASISLGPIVAVPAATTLAMIVLILAAAYVAIHRTRADSVAARALAPLVGFVGFALVFALAVALRGEPLDNYYIWKSASAAAIAGLPALLGFVAAAVVPARSSRRARAASVAASVSAAMLVMLPFVSEGPSLRPSATVVLEHRLDRISGRSPDGAGLVAASAAVADARGVFLVLPPDAWGWEGRPGTATEWLNALRDDPRPVGAVRPPLECVVGATRPEVEQCAAAWETLNPSEDVTVVDLRSADPGGSTGEALSPTRRSSREA